jgi:hypothetical protein
MTPADFCETHDACPDGAAFAAAAAAAWSAWSAAWSAAWAAQAGAIRELIPNPFKE